MNAVFLSKNTKKHLHERGEDCFDKLIYLLP